MTPNWVDFAIIGGKAIFIWAFALSLIPVLIWFERKGAAFIQDRAGPNRAAVLGIRLAGLIHNIADVVKLLMKEMMIPPQVNRTYFMIAPVLGFTFILTSFAVIPWADHFLVAGRNISMQVADLNAGILYILAVTSLNVYGIVLAGWSSNNKFALMGGLRSTAQMISYEIPLGLALVGVFMVFSTVQLNEIVRGQGDLLWGFLPRWGVVVQPLGAILFIVAAFAETNRNPFDLPEGESEIVAGYHVEYSGMRFALFYMGEYAAMVLSAAMITTLFFGGWQIPWFPTETIVAHAHVWLKVMLGVGGVGALAFAVIMFIWARRMRVGGFGDMRDQEGNVLGTLNILVGVAMLFFLFKVAGMNSLPEWGARTVTLVAQISAFAVKTIFWCWVFIWVRWSLPRFRYDQLMRLGWKNMIPLSFVNILLTGLVLILMGK
ncbi:MAG: NADH-quinone oxidoreductase subunit H [Candidatus Krumholzibacteria bacterium]|nr:NADH-quinone oxidoreductase subunit H [Candidatus Krumholzibacteria bacterium]MDH4337914.1 NADH-quinone oxidoreductase subunit H [Candidatus Krumholzibacteria bacterium]MDH5627545.1 NADH-quinone oxidoreductase subunit H [Candidatus Krumholzibacteria bacterium]